VPENGKLRVELYGELAALLNLANGHPRSKKTGVQITLVAGARSHLPNAFPIPARSPKIGPNPGLATATICSFVRMGCQ
jgi:hypothetical protein